MRYVFGLALVAAVTVGLSRDAGAQIGFPIGNPYGYGLGGMTVYSRGYSGLGAFPGVGYGYGAAPFVAPAYGFGGFRTGFGYPAMYRYRSFYGSPRPFGFNRGWRRGRWRW
jgi:hypothetical protein